jgi:hypothetical protein
MPPSTDTSGLWLVVGDRSTYPFLYPGQPQPVLINSPCCIVENYSGHSSGGVTTISVPLGAKGIVKGLNKGWTFVDVVLLQDQPGVTTYRGWVPAKIVKVGYEATYGTQNTIRLGANLQMLGNLTAVSTNAIFINSPTCQVLSRFWNSIWRARKILTPINQKNLDAILKHGGPDGVTRKIFSDIGKDSPGVIQLLDSGKDCTAKSINDKSKAVFKKGLQTVYNKLYEKIPRKSQSDKPKPPGYYVGVTGSKDRDYHHEADLMDPNSKPFHYRYARGAEVRSFRTLATFHEVNFRPLFEQSIICLLDSQAFYIKSAQSTVNLSLIGADEFDTSRANLGDLADRKIQGKLFYEV